MVDRVKLEAQLVLHEGLRQSEYIDTVGCITVGVGYNRSARGVGFLERVLGRPVSPPVVLTEPEARAVLRADIARLEPHLRAVFPAYDDLDEVRQRVVMDLAFNLQRRALLFTRAIDAVKHQDWPRANRELLASHWAFQVDDGPGGAFGRADRLADMLLTGQDYTR